MFWLQILIAIKIFGFQFSRAYRYPTPMRKDNILCAALQNLYGLMHPHVLGVIFSIDFLWDS